MRYQVFQLDETRIKFRNEHGNMVDGISGRLKPISPAGEFPDPISALEYAKHLGYRNPIIGDAK